MKLFREKKTVLIVDDERDNLVLYKPSLKGFDVEQVHTVREAIARLSTPGLPPDAIILDLRLPDGDGFEVLRWIRQHELREISAIPVVVVSAYADWEARVKAMSTNRADFFLAKPPNKTALADFFRCCLTPEGAGAVAYSPDPPPAVVPPVEREYILLVEEDEEDILIFEQMLGGAYEIVVKKTIRAAKACIDEGPLPGAIFLDLMLPDGEGFDLLKWLRNSSRHSISSLPVCILSGFDTWEHRIRAQVGARADFFLSKPPDREAVLEFARHCMPDRKD